MSVIEKSPSLKNTEGLEKGYCVREICNRFFLFFVVGKKVLEIPTDEIYFLQCYKDNVTFRHTQGENRFKGDMLGLMKVLPAYFFNPRENLIISERHIKYESRGECTTEIVVAPGKKFIFKNN